MKQNRDLRIKCMFEQRETEAASSICKHAKLHTQFYVQCVATQGVSYLVSTNWATPLVSTAIVLGARPLNTMDR